MQMQVGGEDLLEMMRKQVVFSLLNDNELQELLEKVA